MDEGTEIAFPVAKAVIHHGHIDHYEYDENDIALLKLGREIKYTDYIQPICLPHKGIFYYNNVL